MPKTPAAPTREQLEREAEQHAARAAELQEQMWQADLEQERRRLAAERAVDEHQVAGYSRAALEAEVALARQRLDEALEQNPLTVALADYLHALRRRSHGINDHVAALARLGRPTGTPSLPSAELGPLGEYVVHAAERLASARVAEDAAAENARREAAVAEKIEEKR